MNLGCRQCKKAIYARGLCTTHYHQLRMRIRRGEMTDDTAVELGLADPRKRPSLFNIYIQRKS